MKFKSWIVLVVVVMVLLASVVCFADSFDITAKQIASGAVKQYEAKIYRTMQLKDGTQAEVFVGTQPIALSQLEKMLADNQKISADLQSKIDKIKELEK